MASTRRLLVLMLWLLPWLQMVKSGYSVLRFKTDKTWDSPVIIPKDGVYLVSVSADSCKGCLSNVYVFCHCHGKYRAIVTAFGDRIYGHAEVAVSLKKNDRLVLKYAEGIEAASSFSVVYVAPLYSSFITLQNTRWTDRNPVTYTLTLTLEGWKKLQFIDRVTTFYIPTTGMYWVAARPNPDTKPGLTMTVKIGPKDLFTVYAEKQKAVSTSGAFRLTAHSTIWMSANGGANYEPVTYLSFVYLAGNKKPYTYPFEHLAFTAQYDVRRYSAAQEVLQFQRVLTNYGYIHVGGYTEIRRTGSYMVSIRPYPESTSTVTVTLYVNGKSHWVMYAEEGVPAGATISLSLQVGSYLEFRSKTATTLALHTMFSVAFVQP